MKRCACGCGSRIDEGRLYASNACRQAAYRRRRGRGRGRVHVFEGDARRLLPMLPAESIDLVVTDPPYVFNRNGGETLGAFGRWFAELPDEAWPAIFAELYRVLRWHRHAYVFGDRRVEPIFRAAARAAGFRVRDPIIWDKGSVGPGHRTWRSRYELALWLEKGRRSCERSDVGNVLQAGRSRGYPTEKPIEILRPLVQMSTRPGELVLDPFCGSGNVARAARDLGRSAIVADVDGTVAASRLRNAAVAIEPASRLQRALRVALRDAAEAAA